MKGTPKLVDPSAAMKLTQLVLTQKHAERAVRERDAYVARNPLPEKPERVTIAEYNAWVESVQERNVKMDELEQAVRETKEEERMARFVVRELFPEDVRFPVTVDSEDWEVWVKPAWNGWEARAMAERVKVTP